MLCLVTRRKKQYVENSFAVISAGTKATGEIESNDVRKPADI